MRISDWSSDVCSSDLPFVVDVGSVRIRAVGTAFSVRRNPEGVDVLVTEGVVETWTEGHEAARTRIAQGERSFVAAGTRDIVAVKAADEIDRALAWRRGRPAFNGEPLSYSVARSEEGPVGKECGRPW